MYEELVKALRNCVDGSCRTCPRFSICNEVDGSLLARLLNDAADAIEVMCDMVATAHNELANVIQSYEESKPRWIPVTERLPEDGEQALVMRFDYVTNMPFYDLLWFDKGEWWNRRYTGNYAVTHWQPLPTPPKEET